VQNVSDKVLTEICRHEDGWCFSQKDFMGIAGRDALDKALSRLVRAGTIRRIGRGLYDVPRYSELLKTVLSPSADQIAKATARKYGWHIQPTAASAANLLNLSTQVPAKAFYLSDGPTKTAKVGTATIYFKHTAPKNRVSNEQSALVIQALKYLGREQVDSKVIAKLRSRLDEPQKKRLVKDARFGTDWIFESVQKICQKKGGGHE
jgi:hypothetical protein